jgi:hypothetical protein
LWRVLSSISSPQRRNHLMSDRAAQKNHRISVHLPVEIQRRLISRARQDARPLADVAAAMLEEALRQLEGWEGTGGAAVPTPAADSPAATDH